MTTETSGLKRSASEELPEGSLRLVVGQERARTMSDWLAALDNTVFKHNFQLSETVTEEDRARFIHERLIAALQAEPNPYPLPAREQMKTAIKENWVFVLKFFTSLSKFWIPLLERKWESAMDILFQPKPASPKPHSAEMDVTEQVKRHWNTTFHGDSLTVLSNMMAFYETNWQAQQAYGKIIPIFQSSGMGKSRLIRELGKLQFQFTFVFRGEGDTGFPPGDTEIGEYLHSLPKDSLAVAALFAALGRVGKCFMLWSIVLSLTLRIGSTWYRQQLQDDPNLFAEDLAARWSERLSPVQDALGRFIRKPDNALYSRSIDKVEIYDEIVSVAKNTYDALHEEWPGETKTKGAALLAMLQGDSNYSTMLLDPIKELLDLIKNT
jgi:hypothetical protein